VAANFLLQKISISEEGSRDKGKPPGPTPRAGKILYIADMFEYVFGLSGAAIGRGHGGFGERL
jgi:hypothetical protein